MHKKRIIILIIATFMMSGISSFGATEINAVRLVQDKDEFFVYWEPSETETYTIQYMDGDWKDITTVTDNTYLGELPYEQIRLVTEEEKSEPLYLTAEQAQKTHAKPNQLQIKGIAGDSSAYLVWEPNVSDSVNYYEIQRKNGNEEYETVKLLPPDKEKYEWSDNDLENDTPYTYQIYAVNGAGRTPTEINVTPTPNNEEVRDILSAIDSLPEDISLKNKEQIKKIRNAYNNLTYENRYRITNIDMLTAAEEKLNDLQADEDKKQSQNAKEIIKDMDDVSEDNLKDALETYNNLSDEQKSLIDKEEQKKLSNAIREYNKTHEEKIEDPTEPTELTREMIQVKDVTYTGKETKPELVITDGDTKLVEGEDFYIYTEAINAGTATATVFGLNNYIGGVDIEYKILPQHYEPEVELNQYDFTYTGLTITPEIKVKTDKKYIYALPKEHKEIGEYNINVIMTGNYEGKTTKQFRINPGPPKPVIKVRHKNHVTVKWITPGYLKQYEGGYQIQCSNNKEFARAVEVTAGFDKHRVDIPGKYKYTRIRTVVKKDGVKLYSKWR